jgi:NAD(P)-dependent dehydrogenase (short-subunit alcohol dehydrogenase family)
VNLDDPNFESTEYSPFVAYGRSKTANILFAVGFDKRYKARGVRATAVHPGGIQTELARHMQQEEMVGWIENMNQQRRAAGLPDFEFKTIPQGSATSVWAGVVAPAEAVGAHYCEDCHVAEVVAPSEQLMSGGVYSYALDPANAEALWKKSEEMVGESF